MYATIAKWVLRAALVAATGWVIWYGYDQVASAFRERKQLRYDLDRAGADAEKAEVENARITAERNQARIEAATVARYAAAEIKARDDALLSNERRVATINKELTHAQRQLADWTAAAEPDLARCLAMPLPGWMFDDADQGTGPPAAAADLHEAGYPVAPAAGQGADPDDQ